MRERKCNRKKSNNGVRILKKRIKKRCPVLHAFCRRLRILESAGLKQTADYLRQHHHPLFKEESNTQRKEQQRQAAQIAWEFRVAKSHAANPGYGFQFAEIDGEDFEGIT